MVDLRQSWEPNQRIVVVVIYIRGWQNMHPSSCGQAIVLRAESIVAARLGLAWGALLEPSNLENLKNP